jgi:hypothetical protein
MESLPMDLRLRGACTVDVIKDIKKSQKISRFLLSQCYQVLLLILFRGMAPTRSWTTVDCESVSVPPCP